MTAHSRSEQQLVACHNGNVGLKVQQQKDQPLATERHFVVSGPLRSTSVDTCPTVNQQLPAQHHDLCTDCVEQLSCHAWAVAAIYHN